MLMKEQPDVLNGNRRGRTFVGGAPMGYVDGANLYQVELSNPVNGLDPSGLWYRKDDFGTNPTVIAEPGDTIKALIPRIVGDTPVQPGLLGDGENHQFQGGEEVDISPLLRAMEEAVRSNIVDASKKFNLPFNPYISIAPTTANDIHGHFSGKPDRAGTDCSSTAITIMKEGLVQAIGDTLWDKLFGANTPDFKSEKSPDAKTIMPGDYVIFLNGSGYRKKHPDGAFNQENAIAIGKDRFHAPGVGRDVCMKDVTDAMIDDYNDDGNDKSEITAKDLTNGTGLITKKFWDIAGIAQRIFDLKK